MTKLVDAGRQMKLERQTDRDRKTDIQIDR